MDDLNHIYSPVHYSNTDGEKAFSFNKDDGLDYISRRRLIREVNPAVVTKLSKFYNNISENKTLLVMSLISLTSKTARNHFIRFILPQYLEETDTYKNLALKVYGSEGYEDFVLTFWQNNNDQDPVSISQVLKFNIDLYKLPFIERTESIVSALENSVNSINSELLIELTAIINIRIATGHDLNLILSEVKKTSKEVDIKCEIKVQTGRNDILISGISLAKEYTKFLDFRKKISENDYCKRMNTQLVLDV